MPKMTIGIAIVANEESKRRAEQSHERHKIAQRYYRRMEAEDNKQKIKLVKEDSMKVQSGKKHQTENATLKHKPALCRLDS